MDDADLKNLSIQQGILRPEFNKNILIYDVIVASHIEQFNIQATTSDKGASYSIKSNLTGFADSGCLKLVEGQNIIVIEITSEDGTIKKYTINCLKLSASNATLKSIDFNENKFKLNPQFESEQFDYEMQVEYNQTQCSLGYDVYDINCIVEVNCNSVLLKKDIDQSFFSFDLNFGITIIQLNVISNNNNNKMKKKKKLF
jgi:hypothetical protein